jgi:YD repeat-containing protein
MRMARPSPSVFRPFGFLRHSLAFLTPLLFAGTSDLVVPANVSAQNLFGDSGFSSSHGSYSSVPYEHVDPLSGNLIVVVSDLSLPGNAGFDLRVTRTYNSKFHRDFEGGNQTLDERTPLGVGWRLHFGRVLNASSTTPGQTVIETPDGGGQPLYQGLNSLGWMTKGFVRYDRTTSTAYFPNGLRYTFAHVGETSGPRGRVLYVTEIRDTFDNVMTFEYGGGGGSLPGSIWRIRQHLSGSQIREVLFTYNGNGSLATMTYDGRTWSYEYDPAPGWSGEWVLRRVVAPIGLPWQYVYNNAGVGPELTGLRPPGGGEMNYAYSTVTRVASTLTQNSRVVTTRSTGGTRITPGTWTFTYNQGASGDTTVVDCPCGKMTYRYSGIGTAGDFSAWKSGVLLERTIAEPGSSTPLESEVFEYQASEPISNDTVTGTSGVWSDTAVRQALVASSVLTRGPQSWTTSYSYHAPNFNDYGRPWRVIAAGDQTRTTELLYDYNFASHWIINGPMEERVSIGPDLRTKVFTYNAAGFLTRLNTYGVIVDYEPNAAGQVAKVKDAHNHETTYTYSWGVRANTVTPLLTTSRAINPDGTVDSENVGTLQTRYVYDVGGRLRRVRPPSYPAVNEIVYEYDDVTTYFFRTSRGSAQTEELMDGLGRVMSTSTNAGVKTSVERDACGRVTFASAPFTGSAPTRGTTTTYDALGRPKTVTAPGTPTSVTTYTYTGADVSVLDAEGRTTSYDYAAFSGPGDERLMRVTDATGTQTNYQYDVLGNLTRVDGPGPGPARVWVYNTRGELQSETQPESGTTSYVYDNAGRLSSVTNAASQVMTMSYDANDRLTGRDAPGTASDVTITYDTLGRVQQQTIDGVATTFGYDTAGRPSSRTDGIHPAMVFSSSYGYDANDNPTTITYPSGRQVTYQYDTAFRLTGVLNNGASYGHTFVYDGSGRLQSFYTGTVGHTTVFDDRDRPSEVAAGPGIGHLRLLYEYDKVSNVKTITDQRAGAPQTVQNYTYDVLNRMKTANGPWGAITWNYDPAGNRISEIRAATTVYNYDSVTNRLTGTTGGTQESFTYNALGQIATNTRGTATTTYSYTPSGLLLTASAPGVSASYLYDADHMRVKRVVNGRTYVTVRGLGGVVLSEYETCGGPPAWSKDNFYAAGRLVGAARANVPLPTITFVNPTLNVAENAGTVNVGVQLVTANGNPLACSASVSVSLTPGTASSGADFTQPSSLVTFPAGTTSGTTVNTQVTIVEDGADEANETFTATLTGPAGAVVGAQGSVAATITDNDPTPSLTINNVSVNEVSGVATFTVSLSALSGQQVQVNYATANSTAVACTGANQLICDYTATSGTLTLPPSTPSGTINVPIVNNTRAELPETFAVNLSVPVNATISTGQGVATITDDEVRAPTDSSITAFVIPDAHSSSSESTYLQLFNHYSTALTMRVTLTWENGTGLTRFYSVPALSRYDVDLQADPAIANTGDYSLTVQSTDATRPTIVAEHSSYTIPGFAGGRNEMAQGVASTQYLPEGSVSTFFDEYITFYNTGDAAVDVTATFVPTFGAPIVRTYRIYEGPGRKKIRVADEVGQIGDHSTIVTATTVATGAPTFIGVERTTTWLTGSPPTETSSTTTRGPTATNQYFAEGGKGFWSTYLSILNPSTTQAASISVAYLHDNGLTYTQTASVGAMQRTVLSPPASMPDGGFGLHVTSTNGVSIAAERAMYAGTLFTLGQTDRAASTPATRWLFAEGASNSFFETFFLVANPNFSAATVRLTFRTTGGTVINTAILTVPARSRIVVNADTIAGLNGTNYATEVNSQNGVSVVAERAMYWPDGNWSGAHVSFGRPQ